MGRVHRMANPARLQPGARSPSTVGVGVEGGLDRLVERLEGGVHIPARERVKRNKRDCEAARRRANLICKEVTQKQATQVVIWVK